LATAIRSAGRCFEYWALGLRGVLYPELYLAGGRLGEKPASFLSRESDHSQLFIVCRGMFLGSDCAGRETRPTDFLGKTRGHANSQGEQVDQQAVFESHRWASVALHSPCRIWLESGLGAGPLNPAPTSPRPFSRQAISGTQTSGMP